MVDGADPMRSVAGRGFTAALEIRPSVASLRHFAVTGPFAEAVAATLGAALPRAGRLARLADGEQILAWRRPGEALLFAPDATPIRRLAQATAALADGCVVDLNGGARVIRVRGESCGELLACMGGPHVIPGTGESRTGRIAELAVTALRPEPDEIRLVVERVYAPHLMDWIRLSALDL